MKRVGLIAAVAATVLVFSLRQDISAATSNSSDTYKELNLFGEVFEVVRADYVGKVDDDSLIESAINGMLTSLDPHSNYLNTKNFDDMKVQTRGEFGGLGIEVSMENGLVKVISPIDDTPAARAGLKPGDLITQLDGQPVQGMTLPQAVEKMRGPVNSDVKLTIRRKGRDPFDVKLTRATIHIQSVRSHLIGDDIGYIRITSFNEQTDVGLNNAMKNIKQQAGDKLRGVDPRFAQQSGRPARSGGRSLGRVPRQGRDRLDPRPALRRRAALQCATGRCCRRAAARRADQRWIGLGQRDRRRRLAGSPPGGPGRHPVVRQRIGADDHPADRSRRDAADDGALLHPFGPLDPGQGDRARHRRRGRQDRASPGKKEAKVADASEGNSDDSGGDLEASSSVDPSIMGTDRDYQLTRAVDMLRGMSLFNGRMIN